MGSYEEAPLRRAGAQHRLIRPLTFMNCSGEAVARLLRGGADPDDLLVILDDVDLPLGRLRIRPGGGAGGHHGLQSILDAVTPATVARMRVGVGRPERETGAAMVEHVLGAFDAQEREHFEQILVRALEALHVILKQGVQPAMNRFNGLPAPWDETATDPGAANDGGASARAKREGNSTWKFRACLWSRSVRERCR